MLFIHQHLTTTKTNKKKTFKTMNSRFIKRDLWSLKLDCSGHHLEECSVLIQMQDFQLVASQCMQSQTIYDMVPP